MVQCAALVETNHGIVNLIMNEYAYYEKGHTIHCKPTDKDLERYPAVHLTGPHEWDPSVLDYTHTSGDGEPPWSNDPDERFALILTLMNLGITPKGQYKLSVFWMTLHSSSEGPT